MEEPEFAIEELSPIPEILEYACPSNTNIQPLELKFNKTMHGFAFR